MIPSNLEPYLIPVLLIAFFSWRLLKFRKVKSGLSALLEQGAIIVDVRSRGEFMSGARNGSINMPLDELDKSSARLNTEKPIVLCCASGTRSAMAATLLKRKGFKNVINAGPWKNTIL